MASATSCGFGASLPSNVAVKDVAPDPHPDPSPTRHPPHRPHPRSNGQLRTHRQPARPTAHTNLSSHTGPDTPCAGRIIVRGCPPAPRGLVVTGNSRP